MSQTTTSPAPPTQMMIVRYECGERYEIATGEHRVLVDQPVEAGGEDLAPTPTELFVAALGSCVAFYAGRYLSRHGLSREGLAVSVTYRMANGRPARVADIHLTVRVPATFTAQLRLALQAVVDHCTVHNSLTTPPNVLIALTTS